MSPKNYKCSQTPPWAQVPPSNCPIFGHLAATVAVPIVSIAIQAARMINFIGHGGSTERSSGSSYFWFGTFEHMSASLPTHIPPSRVQPDSKICLKIKMADLDLSSSFFFDIPTAPNVRLNFWYRVPLSVNTLITSWAFAWWVFVAVRWEVLFFIWSIKFYQNWSPGVIAVYYLQA